MIKGRDVIIKTDHKPFQQKADKASPRQTRQLDFIGQFSTKITHIAETDNIVADALSCIKTIEMPVLISITELANAQATDDELQEILKKKGQWNLHKIQVDDSDVFIYCDLAEDNLKPYVPVCLRKKIFRLTHGFSHPSRSITKKLISRSFVCPGMNKNIAEWVCTCVAF